MSTVVSVDQSMPGVQPILLTKREAAKALSVSERTVDRWRESNQLPYVKPEGKVLFPLAGLREWVARQICTGVNSQIGMHNLLQESAQ